MKAVILLNMGGARDKEELKMFLKNMFNDKYILPIPWPIRSVVAFFITQSRLEEAAKNYEQINYSPLLETTLKVQKKLQSLNNSILVEIAMRYTNPRAKEALQELKDKDVKDVFLLPMYPHFSTTTVKSCIEDIFKTAKELNYFPNFSYINNFYQKEEYLKIIIKLILKTLSKDSPKDFHLIFSAHSLPQKIIEKGDSYEDEVKENIKLLTTILQKNNIEFKSISLAYQSKLGPIKWLEPSLQEHLKKFKNQKVIIFPLSFTIDNSETLFELHIEYMREAKELGISDFRVSSCPNDDDEFIQFLNLLTRDNL
jgi:ferrochelatase